MTRVQRVSDAVRRHGWRTAKRVGSRVVIDEGPKVHLLISGCQRSGTTMLSRIFDADPRAFIFDEISSLSSHDQNERLRFNDLADVERQVMGEPAQLVVSKPLVESQRLRAVLDLSLIHISEPTRPY